MTEIEYKELFNKLANNEEAMILKLVYVSLISSDRVTDLDSCNKSLNELQKMREALASCDIDCQLKERWEKRIESGLEICERDKQGFINEIN